MRLPDVHIGELDKKFLIEQRTTSRDTVSGEQVKTWSTFGQVWGKWLKKSNEKFEGDQQVALQDTEALIRWMSGINETMRINDSGTYHYIKGIQELDRRVTMVLKTERRNNE